MLADSWDQDRVVVRDCMTSNLHTDRILLFYSLSRSSSGPRKNPTIPADVGIEPDETSMDIFGRDALAELNEALLQLNNISEGLSFFWAL